ncbi:DUF4079 domain-containing protein [Microcoleus sp. MOSTC5]|uniref:DUF4079 domain-containing protein n=1 Tax=Microcoleus sp. MOSTC5 TaxID=3055378 RepID=UPI002FD45DDF
MNKINSRLQRLKLDAGILLGLQDGIFRRDDEWLVAHFYYNIDGTLLRVFSRAIAAEIYHARSHRWRKIHTVLNCIALLLFLCQRVTGYRYLLDICLSWQK